MTTTPLPPAPIRDPWGNYTWEEWFRQLRNRATASLVSVEWTGIDFTGSNLTSILTRNHNDLQNMQGGTSAEYYHLTSLEYTNLQRDNNVTTVGVNTTLSDIHKTVVVNVTACTITLPAGSTNRIGQTWTVILDVDGYVDIVPNGSDTIVLPNNDTNIRITTKGGTITLRCLTATTWGLI